MTVTLTIEKVVFGGEGIAFHEGQTFFVENVLPGEKVLAKVTQTKKNFSKARLIQVLEASPYRTKPPCRYYDHCGGCQYQVMTYEEELKVKEGQINEIFSKFLPTEKTVFKAILHGPSEYRYRSSLTLHPAKIKGKSGFRLGFVGKDNTSVIPVSDCLIADEKFDVLFNQQFDSKKAPEKISFKISETDVIASDTISNFVRMKIGDTSFLVPSTGFFQTNLLATSLLMDQVQSWVEKANPQIFYDLYAGVGTFSFICAKNIAQVICVEENPASIQALRMNQEEKKLKDLKIIEGKVENAFPKSFSDNSLSSSNLVFLDPPRQGIAQPLAEFLSKQENIQTLIYVSCDPTTLVRDLKIILKNKLYKIKEVIPLDMFPRTKHIEVAVLLSNSSATRC